MVRQLILGAGLILIVSLNICASQNVRNTHITLGGRRHGVYTCDEISIQFDHYNFWCSNCPIYSRVLKMVLFSNPFVIPSHSIVTEIYFI